MTYLPSKLLCSFYSATYRIQERVRESQPKCAKMAIKTVHCQLERRSTIRLHIYYYYIGTSAAKKHQLKESVCIGQQKRGQLMMGEFFFSAIQEVSKIPNSNQMKLMMAKYVL